MSVNPVSHQLADALRIFGLRDRLRCPRCRAVGTWKPHGGWMDVEDERKVRRWICKWCGLYRGPEGELQAGIGATAWTLESSRTPKSILDKETTSWPWFG